MVAVLEVQAAVDDVVDVVAVRHGFMAAAFTVYMAAAIVGVVADIRVGGIHFQDMLVIVAVVFVVQMAVVEIVDVVTVADGGVAAAGTVNMVVMGVGFAAAHDKLLAGNGW